MEEAANNNKTIHVLQHDENSDDLSVVCITLTMV